MFSKIVSRNFIPIATTLAMVYTVHKANLSAFCDGTFKFDTRGFSERTPITISNSPFSLNLSGVGMRRKNFYVVEVDVYLVGISLSDQALKLAKEWKANHSDQSAAQYIINNQPAVKGTGNKTPYLSASLRFVRGVTKEQITEAFNDAFVGGNEEEIKNFKTSLGEIVHDGKVGVGEEIGFVWIAGGGLQITRNGTNEKIVNAPSLESRLLSVYIDADKTVSKELIQSFNSNIMNL